MSYTCLPLVIDVAHL